MGLENACLVWEGMRGRDRWEWGNYIDFASTTYVAMSSG
jgi:hypothetical protein